MRRAIVTMALGLAACGGSAVQDQQCALDQVRCSPTVPTIIQRCKRNVSTLEPEWQLSKECLPPQICREENVIPAPGSDAGVTTLANCATP